MQLNTYEMLTPSNNAPIRNNFARPISGWAESWTNGNAIVLDLGPRIRVGTVKCRHKEPNTNDHRSALLHPQLLDTKAFTEALYMPM